MLALTLLMPALGIVVITTEVIAIMLANLQFTGTAGGYFEADDAQLHDDRPRREPRQDRRSPGRSWEWCAATRAMNAKGGPLGVGRAVNQAVVISFVVIWTLNFAFNSTYLGAFPGAQAVR